MSQSTASTRYAKALFQLAVEHKLLKEVTEDLREVKIAFKENGELFQLLDSPRIGDEKKKAILSELFASVQPIIVNALKLLVDKKRIHEVVNVIDAFIEQANAAQGIADAIVFSTRPLTEQEKKRISATFAGLVGKNALHITNEIEPGLIGGIRVQIGNQIYDNSVSTKLTGLQRKLIG
ncbi:F0F1 ATP synthase subunit delta [Rummeliibacillus stabekisii]|uniref:ATP synthase subunit delta n=1 Tax=Rummeliibacillus stabekisii TaxID=241244 RepID=A0A143HGR0_9BACL|nr:F0F1 ATP synthase subunit delta [Rummeliibacillus stabekisii]AMX00905.1 F0F1 ATP synthase subunit delta [Rummeliibacillus stabekisii]